MPANPLSAMDRSGKRPPTPVERLKALVAEAECSFAGQPKALWSDRTYLAPKDARALRELLTGLAAHN